jgi:hypothetical protein
MVMAIKVVEFDVTGGSGLIPPQARYDEIPLGGFIIGPYLTPVRTASSRRIGRDGEAKPPGGGGPASSRPFGARSR